VNFNFAVGQQQFCSLKLYLNALTLLVGQQEGHPAFKNWVLVCWW